MSYFNSFLVVDDDIDVIELMTSLLAEKNTKLLTARSGKEALEVLKKDPSIDLVITDIRMPDMDGIALLKEIKKNTPNIEVIIMTAYTSLSYAISAVNLGAERYIQKPFQLNEMQLAIKQVEDKLKLRKENQSLIEKLEHAKQELENKNEKLNQLDKLKDEFISTVSHELRTPLTIMKEFVSILLDKISGGLTEAQEEHLHAVQNNIERLALLINDLLDITKIESGKLNLAKTETDLGSLIKDVVSSFETPARKKEITLTFDSPSFPPVIIDPGRIVQVITNLIGNAIKFTPEKGSIGISAEKNNDYIEISVADTGIGINSGDFEKIFNKFEQINRLAGSGAKGTGLGLAISKRLVELHGGSIRVESPVTPDGKGSRFTFSLPLITNIPEL